MNDFDPMKDDSAGQTAHQNDRAAGQSAHSANGADGHGYTNPDGSHGYVYNARAAESRTRRYRGALIAVSAVLITLLTLLGCLSAAMMALRNLRTPGGVWDDYGNAGGEIGTSDELYISDGAESAQPTDTSATLEGTSAGEHEREPAEVKATIQKLPAEREDKDRDGKADLAYDATGNVLTSAGDSPLSVATVVARVSASVVEITTETIVQSGFLSQYITSGAGSGVIIAEEGYIVTNHHVIDGASTITVRLNDGTEFPATLVGTDEATDVAVLKIDAAGYTLTVATIGASYDLVVGEDILAIGNPLGSLGGTVTEGMISATEREINVNGTDMTLLQVSAPINPGNSGGGLFNLAGELIGVVNAKMSSEEIEGLGFAIPSDTAYQVICELIDYGYVRGRPSLGVSLDEVSYWSGDRYVMVGQSGHELLRYQDLILAVNGTKISSISELSSILRRKSVGDTVELTVYRNNRQITVTVSLVEDQPAD